MRNVFVVLACLACRCHGQQAHRLEKHLQSIPSADIQRPFRNLHPYREEGARRRLSPLDDLAKILLAFIPAAAFGSPSVGVVRVHNHALKRFQPNTLHSHRSSVTGMGEASPKSDKPSMERPALDKVIAKGFEKVEMARLNASLVENEDGSVSEPLEWAEPDSVAQKVSKLSQSGPFAMFKQFIADRLAGDFDEEAIDSAVDEDIADNAVLMYSFSTCPFCLKSKQLLDEKGVEYKVRELDLEEDGYAIRAILGRRTGRTSMPSIWVGGEYVGGANDGGLGGVVTLDSTGKLEPLLKKAGAL